MDSNVDPTKFSTMSEQNDGIIPDIQINPLTIMTSVPPFTPVDENQQSALESTDINLLQPVVSDNASTSLLNADISLPNMFMSSSNIADQQTASNTHMDNQSVAAWVESTTAESNSPTIERSPSLPSTLLESNLPRSRRNSTVSTICDQQQSIHSDTLTSQQVSFSNDTQRSLSLPVNDQYYRDNDDNELILPVKQEKEEEEEEDTSMQFLPVPESEDSEVDKKTKKLPSVVEEPVKVEDQSSTSRVNSKTSSNVSFHASVSFETHHKSLLTHRRRRNSGNATKTKPPLLQRSYSHTPNPPPPSLHAQILRKQFQTALSMPTGAHPKSDQSTRQSSSVSDNVFFSPSTTNSSRGNRFQAVPSSGSILSSGRNASIISDASGRSGIESTNLESTPSDIIRMSDINIEERIHEKPLLLRSPLRSSSPSARSSTTPSTQSLSSSTDDADDETNHLNKKSNDVNTGKGKRKGGTDQRRDVLKQLMWLLEKKTTIYARPGSHRKSITPPKQQHQKSTPNLFVEFCSTFRSHNAHNASSRHESDIPSKSSIRLFSSFNEPSSNQLYSLPLSSQMSYTDPMNQSFSSVRSTHSDSSATTPLINTKFSTRHSTNATTSLASSLHFSRKRGYYRRNITGLPAITRDPKSSFNKSDQQTVQQEQEPKSPFVRNTEAILNEHITMINNLLLNFSLNASIHYPAQNSSFRDFLYTRLNELSQQNPMNQRCSRVETKAFIDLISSFQMNRAHHYSFLTDSVKHLATSNNETIHLSNRFSENEDEVIRDGHIASNESSNASSPCLTRYASSELNDDGVSFEDHPLRYFRTLSQDYILDCERTENELKKLFDLADQQHILYCLKHVDSGHTNDSLTQFHRRLDALFVWFNLYYELTISVKKLSGLLRCDECEDWPKLRFRSIATSRERQAKRADENDVDCESTSEDEEDEEEDDEEEEEDLQSTEDNETEDKADENDDSDILPKNRWPEEPLDHFSRLRISDESTQSETNSIIKLNRIDCYRNFVYYMDKRSYQVKYDGLARTLIERIAPVLVKTRLALLQITDRHKMKIEQVLAGLSLSDFQSSNIKKSDSQSNLNIDETEDKLVDTDNPVDDDSTRNLNLGELTIEKWLYHVLKSCSTIKNICSSTEDILKNNWFELHQQLGLPSLLPLYFFIMNVLLDVMNECLKLDHKSYMKDDAIEIDSLDRQQLVREAKLVLRDALATRLYSIRMMEQFISHRKIIYELTEFDENTVKLYMHYKQFLSTVCINRNFCSHDDGNLIMNNEGNTDIFQYVDETSELIKEYYFSRDLTVTLGSRTEIRDLCIDFSTLTQRILAQLKEELNGKTEKYYQTFAIDLSDTSNSHDGSYSADVIFETHRPPLFCTSASVPPEISHGESLLSETTASFSEQKRNDIISKTREFRREFDVIKQRATRVCNLVKTLIDDFSIAAEFRCLNHSDLWQQLRQHSYTRIKINLDSSDTEDFDNFYVFIPSWLSTEKDEVEKLLSIICSQQIPVDEMNKTTKDISPSYMLFLPKKNYHRQKHQWTDKVLLIQPSESTKLALNSTEINSLHLVVNRYDQWQNAVDTFQSHVGLTNIQLIRKLPRDEDIRITFDQLPEHIERLSIKLTDLVRTLNTIWNQDSTKIYLTEIVKFDEFTIESKLVDLVLYIYNSGFDLFRLLYELIPTISSDTDEIFKNFVSIMNDFFCEWCKCVTKKFKYTSIQQARTAKYKVLKPKWLSPGMVFFSFLAKPIHLQLISEEDYKKLIKEMPAALDVLYGNTKARADSVSSTSTHLSRPRGHRRIDSGGRYSEIISPFAPTPRDRIVKEINNLENQLEKKYRERKQIGQIFITTSNTPDPVISLRMRNIDFPWRRGTRIGQGGAGVAFRAINCSNGSIVCMKEIQLTSIASRLLPSTYPGKLRLIAEEINMIMSINHPNIVRYFGIEKYKRTIYICMEYCLSTVNEFLNDIRSFQKRAHIKRRNSMFDSGSSEQDEDMSTRGIRLNSSLDVNETVRGFVRQLLHALMVLHENYIVHCDVKGDNIFIANDGGKYIVKLGDFNLSHRLELESRSADSNDSHSTQKGTLYFKPPEPEYVYKSDIWALGCTIIEMLTGKLPWTNVTRPPEDQIYIQNQLLAKKGPPIPDELKNQKEAYEFIELCLKPDLEKRRSARELLNHPYSRVRTDS